MAGRATIDVATPAGGWGARWPNIAEIEAALPHDRWTLVGGLWLSCTVSDVLTNQATTIDGPSLGRGDDLT
jgi:hypothetical protein